MKGFFSKTMAIIAIATLLFMPVSSVFSQETAESVTEAYNNAITMANEDPVQSATILAGLLTDDGTLVLLTAETKTLIEEKLPAIQYKAGNALFKEKKYSEALNYFNDAKASAEAYNNAGVAAQVDKVLPKAHYAIGMSHLKNKENDKAMASFDEAIALNGKYAKAYFGKSRVFRAKGDLESVYEFTDKALELADDKTKASIVKSVSGYLYKKAKSNSEKSKFQDAIDLLEKAIAYDTDRDQGRYYYELGKAYQAMGRSSDACSSYKKATGKYAEGAKYQMEHKLKCS